MRTPWRSSFVAALMLITVLPLYTAGSQEAASGSHATKHDAVIKGSVTSKDGKNLPKAHVTIANLATEEKTETQTDDSGRFQFSGLFSGRYRLEAKTEKGETASDEVSLGSGETVIRKLVVRPQG